MNSAQKLWFDTFIRTGDDIRAVEVAYPSVAKANRSSKAGYLKSKFAQEIDKASRKLYVQEAPKMMSVIKDLALNSEQPAVKLKAADTWLSRAGHDAAQVVEVKDTQTHEQLLERLKIATQGIDPSLLAAVLPNELKRQLEASNGKEETKH